MLLLANAVSTSLQRHLTSCLEGCTADSHDSVTALQSAALAGAGREAVSLASELSVHGDDQNARSLVIGAGWLQYQPAVRRMLRAGFDAQPDAADMRALAVLAQLPIEGVL